MSVGGSFASLSLQLPALASEPIESVMTVAHAAPAQPASPKPPDHNRLGLDFRRPMPRPKVKGIVIDAHTHLLANRHTDTWFEATRHYGIDAFVSMTPLEEALDIQRNWAGRVQFIAIPKWQENSIDDWLGRVESFYNIGSPIIKFHMAPGTMFARKWRLDSPDIQRIMREAAGRGMILMSHVGDPDTWYHGKYSDSGKYGTREEHYRIWEDALTEYKH